MHQERRVPNCGPSDSWQFAFSFSIFILCWVVTGRPNIWSLECSPEKGFQRPEVLMVGDIWVSNSWSFFGSELLFLQNWNTVIQTTFGPFYWLFQASDKFLLNDWWTEKVWWISSWLRTEPTGQVWAGLLHLQLVGITAWMGRWELRFPNNR